MKKVFVGIKISDALSNQIYNWQKDHFDLPVRFLARQNLHITLIPPWPVHEDELPALKARLCEFRGNLKPFNIFFNHISLGPNPQDPRLIWATGKTPPELIALKNLLENKISLLNDLRPLLLHVTVARFNPPVTLPKIDGPVSWSDTVNTVALYETVWDAAGPEYEVLEEVLF